MATIEELVIQMSADNKQLQADMKAASGAVKTSTDLMSKALDSIAKNTEKSSSSMRKVLENFAGNVLAKTAVGGFNLLKNAASAAFQTFIVDGIKAAAETETAMNGLLAAMARTGQQTAKTRDNFDEFASAMQNSTAFGDDAILNSAALIQNLARLDEEGLKAATRGAADLAAAMGIDLQTASKAVGKALNGNGDSLKRLGIEIDEGANKSRQFAQIMEGLNSRFGGAAADQLKTFGGASKALANSFQDVTKVFGNVIVQNPAVINAMNSLRIAFNSISAALSEAAPQFKVLVAEALKPAASAFNAVAQGALFVVAQLNAIRLGAAVSELDSLENSLAEVENKIKEVKQTGESSSGIFTFDESAVGELEKLRGELEKNVDAQRKYVMETQQGTAQVDEALSKISDASSKFAEGVNSYDAQKAAIKNVNDEMKKTPPLIEEQTALQKAQADEAIKFAEAQLAAGTTARGSYESDLEALQLSFDNKLISEDQYLSDRLTLLETKQAEEQALLDAGLALKGESEMRQLDATLALGDKQDLEREKFRIKDAERDKKLNEEKLAAASQTFGNLATLSKTGNKELGAIGKAAAIAQATVDGYAAVQKALASAPPPFNFALAASVGIATGVNIAKIASTPLASGIDSVPGSGFADNFPAILAPGERVVPRDTNQDLTKFLNTGGQASGQSSNITVNVSISDVFTTDPREFGLKIIESINEASQANGIQMIGSRIK